MTKKDIAITISAADRLLETTTDPLHRQILENYRRHAILEICGEWKDIFVPDMTVEYPIYYYNVTGFAGDKAEGPEKVQSIYRMLAESGSSVQLVEDERLMVSDWGFCSEAVFNSYYRGYTLNEVGVPVDDPEGYFIMRQKYVMLWPYDERGRMIGEQVYENRAFYELTQIPEEDFLTLADVRERLLPMLRPLPHYDPTTRGAAVSAQV
jgi:hypothetical protein